MATIRGGAKLDKALAIIAAKLKSGDTLRVGFLEGATYPATSKAKLRKHYKGKQAKPVAGSKGGTPVALVAAVQEFGSPTNNIPPRPFFRNMVAEKSKEWPKGIETQLKRNNYDVLRTLEKVGEAIKGQLQKSIINTNSPPLKPRTIEAKGFAKPLIDTAHMLNSVDYEIVTSK